MLRHNAPRPPIFARNIGSTNHCCNTRRRSFSTSWRSGKNRPRNPWQSVYRSITMPAHNLQLSIVSSRRGRQQSAIPGQARRANQERARRGWRRKLGRKRKFIWIGSSADAEALSGASMRPVNVAAVANNLYRLGLGRLLYPKCPPSSIKALSSR